MNWYWKYKTAAVQIMPFDYDSHMESAEDTDYDPNERMDQADDAFQKSNIRYDRQKSVSHVAVEDGRVIGAVASGWSKGEEFEDFPVYVYSFDIAVQPQFRGPAMIGLKLIAEAIRHYESTRQDYRDMGANTMMRLWVVNPRLVPVLESKFGFEIEGEHGDGSAHMIRY